MNYQDFLGRVQARARLASSSAAIKVTRATLMTLGERLLDDQADQLAAQLPEDLAELIEDRGQESFDLDEFITRVSLRADVDRPEALYQARVVLEVLGEAVSAGSFEKLRNSLPHDMRPLLAGSAGPLPKAP
jgi:uncharacterized protein (DUF2267 family)